VCFISYCSSQIFLYYMLEHEDDPPATEVYEQDQDPALYEPVIGKQPIWCINFTFYQLP
jgi:hypothetical protein